MAKEKILSRELFLDLLDMEVNRGIRYQNYFSLLKVRLSPLPGYGEGKGLKSCSQNLSDLLMEELRDSDVLGALAENQLAVLMPYADSSAGSLFKSRLSGCLKYYDFTKKGYAVLIDLICFPVDGTSTASLIERLLRLRDLESSESGVLPPKLRN